MHVIGVEQEFAAEVDGGIQEMDAMDQLVVKPDMNAWFYQKVTPISLTRPSLQSRILVL